MQKSCLKHFKYQTCFNSIKTLLSGFEKSETGFEPSTLRLSFKGGRRKKGMAALHVSVTTQLFKLTRRAVPTRTLQHAAWSCTCTTAGSIARCALRTLPFAGRPGMTFSTHPKFTIWRFFEYGLELPGSEPSKSLSSFTVTLTMHICVLTHFHFVQTLQKSDYQLSSTQIFGWLAMSRFLFCNNT